MVECISDRRSIISNIAYILHGDHFHLVTLMSNLELWRVLSLQATPVCVFWRLHCESITVISALSWLPQLDLFRGSYNYNSPPNQCF